MNWDQIEGNWILFAGRVKQRWGKLTENDLMLIAGSRDELLGKLLERYGYGKNAAERELAEFMRTL